MRLIRIGNSQSCDLKLDSEYVSSLHAEMTILDDGQIILEDKNSRNGTTVGNKKLEPGKEVTVQRGDMITFADTPLVWARIPAAEKLSNNLNTEVDGLCEALDPANQPKYSLEGFERITLAPGESGTVTFKLGERAFDTVLISSSFG